MTYLLYPVKPTHALIGYDSCITNKASSASVPKGRCLLLGRHWQPLWGWKCSRLSGEQCVTTQVCQGVDLTGGPPKGSVREWRGRWSPLCFHLWNWNPFLPETMLTHFPWSRLTRASSFFIAKVIQSIVLSLARNSKGPLFTTYIEDSGHWRSQIVITSKTEEERSVLLCICCLFPLSEWKDKWLRTAEFSWK